ncbi:dehydratase [Sulfuricella sp. T08]|uniref:MaoC family dehydratase n=1 Tax=Sulfuricella sp. T08 TaxID=1632857 RepID=UPI000617A195|nr:MaoC family dehydratase [Sulfuricella sp. T08]GAO37274.1 dehydratase [Sulfuricella sp. T08]
MNKASTGNYFEDFSLGQTLVHGTPRTVGEGEASLYIALTGARQVLHSAKTVAHALGYKDRPLDDLLVFNIAFGKTVPDISLNAVANLGYADVRFLRPVHAGDTISAESTVVGLRENANRKSGIVWVRSTALNQNGEEILSWVRWVMVHKKSPDSPAPTPVVPEAPAFVAPDRLMVPAALDAQGFETEVTGGPWLWDDYAPLERIDHLAGMTVDESDHTLATKLYQNNARVHFDAHAMKDTQFGRRLVYGGHVISVCRALAYDGLENALTIAAINGGSHCNPTFGGDTLYAYSEVLDKWELPGRSDLGALRLRMVGVKNLPPAELVAPQVEEGGMQRYHPSVVLDLDYTVLIPRR